MKSFKEISQNIISLSESLFDMANSDGLSRVIKKDTMEAFLKTCKGNFSTVYFKDGSVRINGKLIISDIKTDKLYFNCRDFHGKLIIENCPGLTTLKDSFLEKINIFDGSISINQCPSLTSLKGLPSLIKGDLSITNCKKLKSYEGIDNVFGNLYWSGNGRKYSDEELKEKTHVYKKVFCGTEYEDANIAESIIDEAFNNPWLQRLASQLKKYPYKEYSWGEGDKQKYNKVDTLFAKYSRESTKHGIVGRILDKITNEDIDTYDLGNEKDKKDISKVFWDAYSADNAKGADVILIYDEDLSEFIGGFGLSTRPRGAQNYGVPWINLPHKGSYNNKMDEGEWLTKSEAKQKLLGYGAGYTAVVINSGNDSGTGADARYDLRNERIKSQAGVINPGDVEQYKKIAEANLKRYKDELSKIRALRRKDSETESYNKIIDDYEKINTRVFKLVRAIAKDPKSFDKYRVTEFLNWIRDEKRYNPNYKPWQKNTHGPQYYGANGPAYIFKVFMDAYLTYFGHKWDGTPAGESDFKTLENCVNIMGKVIELADQKLKTFGF